MIATFKSYQDRIRANVDLAEALIAQGPEAIDRINAVRADQGAAMAAYQLFMHREVFAPAIRSSSPARSIAARELKIECITLFDDFSSYVRMWSRSDPVADWDSYHASAMQMLARVRAHLNKVGPPVKVLLAARVAEQRVAA